MDDIDFKKTQEALKSEQYFRDIFENTSLGISIVNSEGRIIESNSALQDMLGYGRDELNGKRFSDFTHPENIALEQALAKEVLDGRKDHFAIEKRNIRKDGKIIWVRLNLHVTFDASRKPLTIVTTIEDITERKKSEEALKEREELYRTLFDNSEDGFILLEPLCNEKGEAFDFRFLKVNHAYERQTGRKAAVVEGNRAKDVAPELEQEWVLLVGRVVNTGKSARYENFNRRTSRWYDAYYFPFAKDKVGILFRDITERKKAEQILNKKQLELNCILDSSPTIIFYKDKEGKFIQVNRAFAEALKTTKEKLLGKTVFDLYSTEIAQGMANDDFAVLRSKRPKLGIVEPYESPTGLRWIRTDKIPSLDENGVVSGLIGFSEDITDRKKAEEALLESEIKYEQLVNKLPEMVFEIDSNGRLIFANLRAVELTGYSKKELEGDFDANRLVAAEDVERSRENMKVMFATGRRQSSEYLFARKDGARFPVLLTSVPIVKDNKVAGARGIAFDITELKKAQQALKESEERYRQLFSSITELFFVVEPIFDKNNKIEDFVYAEVNPAFLESVGKTRAQLVGKRSSQLFGFVDDLWLNIFNEIELTRHAVHAENFSQITGRYYQVYAWMINSKQLGIICEDITEHKALEMQLQENERLAAIGQTAGMVGHDIRNPLQAMLSDVFLLKTLLTSMPEMKTKAEVAESLDGIEKSIGYVDKIVADLQDYARPLKPEYSDVELSQVISSVFKTIEIPDNIKLSINVNAFLKIKTEPTFIRRALTNLVNNAIQAMPNGGKLELSSYKKKSNVYLTVSDTGVGIPEELKPRLFAPMTTTKAKGQGLGLAVVKRLVEALDGKITFESQEGKGTKFIIELPLQQQEKSSNIK